MFSLLKTISWGISSLGKKDPVSTQTIFWVLDWRMHISMWMPA
ncbi:hypothetical protein CsSME_00005921 [Camellia sinensis var. sinensis]